MADKMVGLTADMKVALLAESMAESTAERKDLALATELAVLKVGLKVDHMVDLRDVRTAAYLVYTKAAAMAA